MILKSFPFNEAPHVLLDSFDEKSNIFFLDSAVHPGFTGRYSFIGFDPYRVLSLNGPKALDQLRKEFQPFQSPERSALTPFHGGCVGYLGYDLGLYAENIKKKKPKTGPWPDLWFAFYDTILTVDHLKKRLYVSASGWPEKNKSLREKNANEHVRAIERHLAHKEAFRDKLPACEKKEFFCRANFRKEEYCRAIEKALKYIAAGDIYQVNLSQKFTFLPKQDYNPLEIYKVLRKRSLAPFGAYLNCGEFQIMSGSPERFIELKGNRLQTRPMKGTRPRGETSSKDKALKKEILKSQKDIAELLMITDLMRNDLGRVCRYGSVRVKHMRQIENHPYVFQATSTIEGRLRKDKNCFDVLAATFPGGSITGCPKIRAMQIIEELEPSRRGPYTGALGYINFNGDMDFNILIRTLLAHKTRLYFQVGGGIVSDSIPEKEYEETLTKAKAIEDSLKEYFCA